LAFLISALILVCIICAAVQLATFIFMRHSGVTGPLLHLLTRYFIVQGDYVKVLWDSTGNKLGGLCVVRPKR